LIITLRGTLYANLIVDTIGIVLMLLINASSKHSHKTRLVSERMFLSIIRMEMFMCIVDMITYIVDGIDRPYGRFLSYASNTTLIFCTSIFIYMFAIYADCKINNDRLRSFKFYATFAIPLFVVFCFGIINLFYPIIFKISADNIYSRMPAFILAWVIDFFYFFYSVYENYKNKRTSQKYRFFSLYMVTFMTLSAAIVQGFIYGVSLIYIAIAVALVNIYFNLQNESSYIDTLSGLYNRQFFNNYLANAIKSSKGQGSIDMLLGTNKTDKILACIILDIDKFKDINDNFGHIEGDKAICEVGNIIMKSTDAATMCARYGGDEFIIVDYIDDEKELDIIEDNIKRECEVFNESVNAGKLPYEFMINVSMGKAIFDEEKDTPESFLKRIDKNMYSEKRKRKAETENRT